MAGEKVLHLNKDNFQQEVINAEQPVLVDFWATWCGPCRMLGPVIDELGEQYNGKVKIAKINVDEQKELAMQYQVMSIPTVILFDKGNIAEKVIGYRTKENYETMLNKYI